MFWMKKKEAHPVPMCEDCRWFRLYKETCPELSKCARPDLQNQRFVTRTPSDRDLQFCGTARMFDHLCGNKGRFFEAKPIDSKPDPTVQYLQDIKTDVGRMADSLALVAVRCGGKRK
ncbi:MAG TPA: hypothetical protein VFA81_10825 [Burkholderiales bacterium]|nr:hypothetical protein [Burkholderiales bacterium]